MSKIRVLIVDDSALVRQVLTQVLQSDSDIEVVGTASDPFIARDKIKQLKPDVLTLDVEMPRMDGITFLRNLMRLHPMPVVMISSLTEKGAQITLDALEIGAVDFMAKPKEDLKSQMQEYSATIIEKVKMAAKAKVRVRVDEAGTAKPAGTAVPPKLESDAILAKTAPPPRSIDLGELIAIGASTGGTEAVRDVLTLLPPDLPGIVITQHIPEAFSGPFAARLDRSCALRVKEAQHGDEILPGHAYVAPGSHHLLVERKGKRYFCVLNDGPRVNRHKPSVDVLFRSVCQAAGAKAVGVILTGMGDDGARGLKEMRDAGSFTIAQDENTSVVWGMPGEAVKLGAAEVVKPLRAVSTELIRYFKKSG
ncbi:MAG: chemotaxis response regulator protein-glutamate methylesterase [Gammaproteobacteria bacterium]|nr:chemotaxis response regulator protein-glutamate methylesterase [Gammaproteobacteria bacterium]